MLIFFLFIFSFKKFRILAPSKVLIPIIDIFQVKDTFLPHQGFYSKEDIAEESNDIAILYLEKKVEIDATVLPVCVDWSGIKLLPGALQSNGKVNLYLLVSVSFRSNT